MADVTISNLSPIAVASGLLLPASDGTSTGSVTIANINSLSPVQSVAARTGAVVLTKTDVGLSLVENKSSATIRGEISSTNVTTALGYTPYNGATNPNSYIVNTDASVAKAWVNFNGWGLTSGVASAATIRSQYNVASITWTTGTNLFDINFATAMSNSNYAVQVSIGGYTQSATATTPIYDRDVYVVYRDNTANRARVVIKNSANTDFQDQFISVVIFGT